MARLVNDSGVLNGKFKATAKNVKDIPFSTLIDAIQVTQDKLGITGTTAKEASETVSGSFQSMVASAKNLISGLGNPEADIKALMSNFGETIVTFAKNIKRVLKTIWNNLPLEGWQKWALAVGVAIGPALIAVGGIIKTVNKLAGTIKIVGAILTNPFGLVLVAISALVLGFMHAYKHSEKFRNVVNSVVEAVKTKFNELKTFVTPAINAISEVLGKLNAGAFAPLIGGIGLTIVAFNKLRKFNFSKIFSFKLPKFPNPFTKIISFAKTTGNAIKGVFSGIGKMIVGIFKGLGQGVATIFKGIAKSIAMLNPVGVASFALAIGAITVSLIALSATRDMVIPFLQGLANVLVSLVGGVLQAFAQAIVTVAPVMQIMAQALSLLSPLIVAMGLAFAIASPFVTALGVAVSAVISAILSGVAIIITALTPIIEIITGAFVQIVDIISNAIVLITQAIAPFIPIITEAFTTITKVISEAIVLIVQALSPFIPELTKMVEAIAPVLQRVVDAFIALVNQIAPILESISNIIRSFGDVIKTIFDGAKGVIEAFGNAIKAILEGVATVIDAIGNAFSNAGEGFNRFADAIIKLQGVDILGIAGGIIALGGAIAGATLASMGLGGLADGIMRLAQGMEQVASTTGRAQGAIGNLTVVTSTVRQQIDALGSAITNLSKVFDNMKSAVDKSLNGLVQVMNKTATAISKSATEIGKAIIENIVKGISNGVPMIMLQMMSIQSTLLTIGHSVANSMRSVGNMIGQGLAVGMHQAIGSVTASANELIRQAERAARAKAQIHSPSRLFRDNVGIFIGQGIAVGIEKSSDDIANSIDDVISNVANFSNHISDVMNGGLNYSTHSTLVNNVSANNDLSQLTDMLSKFIDRDIVVSVKDREIVRATGKTFDEYKERKTRMNKMLRGVR